MTSLSERLTRPEIKPKVVDDVCGLVEREVAGKRGFGGAAVKAGFAVVTRVKPGFIREVVTKLLPDFADALQPIYDESAAQLGEGAGEGEVGEAFARRVAQDRSRAAEALLGVTDRKIGGARPAVRRAYEKLRPNALGNVESALPGLIDAILPYLKAN
jgi:hypothetical protein